MINLIACVTLFKNKLAIGRNNSLLFKLKEDIIFFKNITANSLYKDSKLNQNIVLMGRKTYDSIPIQFRPLKNRINLVLTNNKNLITKFKKNKIVLNNDNVYYVTIDTFKKIYDIYNPNVFVIGGSEIYNMFLNRKFNLPLINKLYITHVQINSGTNIKFLPNEEPNIFMDNFDCKFKLVGYSDKYIENETSYRILYYNYIHGGTSEEYRYLDLMERILKKGNSRENRTGTGTIGLFGTQLRFDISESIPLMTTKFVPFKTIVEELLWFCRGDSDAKILQNKGIKIWDGNSSREFLDNRGLYHYPEGVIGSQYGFLWRHFGAHYSPTFADTSKINRDLIGGFDQLKYVENLLQNDPFSRRIIITAWSPDRLHEQALPSCFPAGTLVLTNNGYKNIEDVLLEDKLFTHKGNWKDIVNLQQKEYNDEMYEFKLMYNSKKIKTTKEHPFYVKDIIRTSDGTIRSYSKEPYWCEAKNITKNHIMCLPINKNKIIPSFNIEKGINQYKNGTINKLIENKNEWFMLGYYIGDGWIDMREKRNQFFFVINKEQKYVYDIISSVVNLYHNKGNETDKVNQYCVSNKVWWEIVKQFGHLAHNKKIPEWIQDAPKEYIEWFIEGYIAADGCKTDKNSGTFTTVSADLAYGLQRLYAKLGKILSVTYQIRPKTTIIEGRTVNQRNTYGMKLCKNEKRKYVVNIDEDYLYYNVIGINKHIENIIVYNFEVADDNSYTVQNISVHNCHILVQFYVTEENNQRYLSCMFTQRSSDCLAWCYNVVSYSILTYILAKKYNMKPKEIIYSAGDCHIYSNHFEQVKYQLTRTPRPFPKLKLDDSIIEKDWKDITIDDFDVIGYMPFPSIKMPMAI